MIIGVEGGVWYEYDETNGERTAIAPQRLARPTRRPSTPAPVPFVSVYGRWEVSGAILAGSFFGVFFGLLAVLVLIMELL